MISSTSTSITFEFTLKTYYQSGNLVSGWYPIGNSKHQAFTLTIKNLKNIDTSLKKNQYNASDFKITSYVRDITNDSLKAYISNTSNYKSLLFDNLPSDSTIKNISITKRTETSVTFTIVMSSVYKNGQLSTSSSYCTFNGLVINGLSSPATAMKESVKTNGIDADTILSSKAPYEVTTSDIRLFIYRNYSKIFDYAPTIQESEIGVNSSIDISSSSSIITTFTFPSYSNDGTNTKTRKPYTLNINRLSVKETELKDRNWSKNTFNINLPTRDLNNDNLKKFILQTTNYQSILFNNLPSDSVINSANITSRTGTSVTFDIVVSSVYKNGKKLTELSDCTFKQLVIGNLDASSTSMKENVKRYGISADDSISSKAPYELTKDDIKYFILRKYNEIFNNSPNISENQIRVSSFDISSATSVTANFTFPTYSDNGSSSTTDTPYTLVINDFTSKETSLKGRNFSGSDFNINIPPRDINNDKLKSFILSTPNYQSMLFDNLPSNSTISSINVTNTTGTSVSFDMTVTWVYKNGKLTNDSIECTFSGLLINNLSSPTTIMKTDVKNNGIGADSSIMSKAPYEVTNDEAKSFIYRNYNNIFDNPPPVTLDDINVTGVEARDSTSIIVNFTFPTYTQGGISSSNEPYNLLIKNLTEKDTLLKNSSFQASQFNINLPPRELNEDKLKKLISSTRDYQYKLFNN